LQYGGTLAGILWQVFAALLRAIEYDRARLRERQRFAAKAIVIDDYGDLAGRIEFEKLGRTLLALR